MTSSSAPPVAPQPPEAWSPVRAFRQALLHPIQRFLAIEAASGVLLLIAAAAALVLANSALGERFHAVWEAPVGLRLGPWEVSRPLHFWVNDGLMTIFFFVVGLEIRREMHEGELAALRKAALPLAAALGGMLVPALIFAGLNHGRAGAAGWAIPMATDIAFAVGVLTLLGRRVPPALRVLLLALAVIDDIGAILVIAVFYSDGVALGWLALAAGAMGVVATLRAAGARRSIVYVAPGVLLWAALYRAGVHPTLAGVILGLMTPVRPWFGPEGASVAMRGEAERLPAADEAEVHDRLARILDASRETLSPAASLQHALHPWVAFAIMPIFALSNAGVALGGAALDGAGGFVFVGVFVGLVAGKLLGVFAASRLVLASGLSVRPRHVSDRGLAVVATVAGIGFTMSIFIAQLAFPPGPLLETAKLAILAASGTAIVLGYFGGRLALRRPADDGYASAAEAERGVEV
jgi:NhaA family Na+:H+ antiporter